MKPRARPFEQIFSIFNQRTGLPAENPVASVLRSGSIVELGRETVLMARNGISRPIEDSAAPIRDDQGQTRGVVLVFRDVSEKNAASATIQRAEESTNMLAAIVESSGDAIISERLDGIITTWNRAAENLFGYTAAEIIGQPASVLMPPDHVDEINRILEQTRRGARVEHFETERKAKNGRIFPVSLSISPIRDSEGNIVGASKLARDITDRKLAEREREQLLATAESAKAEAEAANRMKDDFLATLSHELRTPLNAILGWSTILNSGRADANDLKEGLSAIERNAHAQTQIIEDLLDISRIISGNLRLEVQRLRLSDVIDAGSPAFSLPPTPRKFGSRKSWTRRPSPSLAISHACSK